MNRLIRPSNLISLACKSTNWKPTEGDDFDVVDLVDLSANTRIHSSDAGHKEDEGKRTFRVDQRSTWTPSIFS